MKTCESCKWWEPIILDGDINSKIGVCRAHPPQVMTRGAMQPRTEATDFCGEHQERGAE